MAGPFQHLKEMPKALAMLAGMFAVWGVVAILVAIIPTDGWSIENRPVSYGELWESGGGILVVGLGMALILFAVGFYKAQGWVRYAVPFSFAILTIYCLVKLDPTARYEWAGALFWSVLSYWYFFWKRKVVNYFKSGRSAPMT